MARGTEPCKRSLGEWKGVFSRRGTRGTEGDPSALEQAWRTPPPNAPLPFARAVENYPAGGAGVGSDQRDKAREDDPLGGVAHARGGFGEPAGVAWGWGPAPGSESSPEERARTLELSVSERRPRQSGNGPRLGRELATLTPMVRTLQLWRNLLRLFLRKPKRTSGLSLPVPHSSAGMITAHAFITSKWVASTPPRLLGYCQGIQDVKRSIWSSQN